MKVTYLEGSVFQHVAFQNTPTWPCRLLLVLSLYPIVDLQERIHLPSFGALGTGWLLTERPGKPPRKQTKVNQLGLHPCRVLKMQLRRVFLSGFTDSSLNQEVISSSVRDLLHITQATFHLKSSAVTTNQYAPQ